MCTRTGGRAIGHGHCEIIRRRKVLLTGADPAENHTTGVENRRGRSAPQSTALRRSATVYRQASLYQRRRRDLPRRDCIAADASPPPRQQPLHYRGIFFTLIDIYTHLYTYACIYNRFYLRNQNVH